MTTAQAHELGVAVVIVTYRSATSIVDTVHALSQQFRERDELVVVDNASDDATTALVREAAPTATVLELPDNLGFAAGCNIGAAHSSAPILLFLNPDALPVAGCLDVLRRAGPEHPNWGAWQALVTMDGGSVVNTKGGVVHYLGIAWAGGYGELAGTVPAGPSEVGFASGAALAVRRETWERLGGFDERFFMYCEDVDFSLRLRLAGLRVGVVPEARVEHEYEFAKGSRKWFLLERNRWWTILCDYPAALLVVLAPALAAFEFGLLGVAARGGWLRSKLRAQAAVLRELPQILARRRAVQRTRTVDALEFASGLIEDLDSPFLGPVARVDPLVAAQRMYWRFVLRVLGLGRSGARSASR
jgi:N-acetylglucosaminyl-diphospho-decaprenol L-rhamnosyltransferase